MTFFAELAQTFSPDWLKSKPTIDSKILQNSQKSRPTGVTIIAILNIIAGVVMLIAAIGIITFGALLPTLPPSAFNQSEIQGNLTVGQNSIPPGVPLGPIFGGIGIVFGAILLAIAIASFVVAYGLWKGLGWAWTVTVILSIISIVFNAISIATAGNFGGIVSIIISIIILYYLYRPHVKAFFGKGVGTSPSNM